MKWLNKRPLIILLIGSGLLLAMQREYARDRDKQLHKQGVDLLAVTIPDSLSDSVKVLTYLTVPNRALQFVKDSGEFIADFETSITLQNEGGVQIGRRIWKNTLKTENYLETTANTIYSVYFNEFHVLPGKYKLISELLDKDTQHSTTREKDLDYENLAKTPVLFTPFFIDKLDGYWGLKPGEIPLFKNRMKDASQQLWLFLSGRVKPGSFSVKVRIKDTSKKLLWEKSYPLESDLSQFEQRILLPEEVTQKGLRKNIEIVLKQGKKSSKKSVVLSIGKKGIPGTIQNIAEAVEQMRYILHDDEWKILSKAKNEEQEALFLEYWDKRDPTPNTPKNELMEEYFSRVQYSNEHFESFLPGWKTDMGMIYILFGEPDDIDRYNNVTARIYSERWYYYRINRAFEFVDENGFGDYRLVTPFYKGRNW
jgi:GWxTD domain-containing protein